jgi:hypothetical protein
MIRLQLINSFDELREQFSALQSFQMFPNFVARHRVSRLPEKFFLYTFINKYKLKSNTADNVFEEKKKDYVHIKSTQIFDVKICPY